MEQIERTRRYLDRIRKIYSGVPYQENSEYYTDDVISFFVHCYHIHDWISTLNTMGLSHQDIDAFINQHLELKICKGLCDGSKHCKLTRPMKTTDQPHIAVKEFISTKLNDKIHLTQGAFTIISDEKTYDALELAECCMKLWDNFIKEIQKEQK